MKAYTWRIRISPLILDLLLVGCEWSTLALVALPPENNPGTH